MILRSMAGMEVSALALGGANFGGLGSARRLIGRGENEAQAHALLDAALALGINLVDTAGSYADGASEAMIGSWLAARGPAARRRVVLSSKVGIRGGLTRRNIGAELERSLVRLGTDHLDLYLAHVPDPATPWASVLETMRELVAAGKIRAFGISNVSAAEIRACAEAAAGQRPGFAIVQNRCNLLDQADAANGVMDACAAAGMAYAGYSPLAGGLLGGNYAYAAALPEGSRLALRPDLYAHLWTEAVAARIVALKALAGDHGFSLPGLAVWWMLHCPQVCTVVLGARSPEQLERLVTQALARPFDAGLFEQARRLSEGTT